MWWIIVTFVVLAVYLTVMLCKIKTIPASISDTYYQGGGIWFTITMLICAYTLTFGFLELSEGKHWQWVSLITASSLGFVGIAPNFESKESKIHVTAAITFVIGAIVWSCLNCSILLLVPWMFLPVGMFRKNWVFWVEVCCIITVMISVLWRTL